MKKKRITYSLLIVLCFLIVAFCFPGPAVQTSFAADDTNIVKGDAGDETYAVFDSSDGSLMLFRGEAGMYEDGQTEGTKVYYSGIEEVPAKARPKWEPHKAEIKSFSIAAGDVIRPAACSYWFDQCSGLQEIDITGLVTSTVRDMRYMFTACTSLNRIDISGLDMKNVAYMQSMFSGCSELTLLKLGENNRFKTGCGIRMPLQRVKLNDDTTLVSEPICFTFNDYIGDAPGWYRAGGKAIAVYDSENNSLTFEDDDNSEHLKNVEEEGTKVYYSGILNTGTSEPPWYEHNGSIKRVTFATTVTPYSCNMWFKDCPNLNVCDLQKLDTSRATTMTNVFAGSSAIYRIALGEKSIFNANLPVSGWKRYMLSDGTETDGPELSNLKYYTGENPGWYSRESANICAVYDSSDGSLTFFNDITGDYLDGQVTGTKTYYENFIATGKIPWNGIKENIRKIEFKDRIEPKNINNWFSGCTEITELDLTNLVIPKLQKYAFRGCVSLKKITVPHSENGNYIKGPSMLSGIWKNNSTNEECKLVKNGEYNNEIIGEGVWELETSAEISLKVNAEALGNTGAYANDVLNVFFSEDGENTVGEALKTVNMEDGSYRFSVQDSTYVSSSGDIEYFDYIIKSSNEGIEVYWTKEQGTSMADADFEVTLRDKTMTHITGNINWEGDKPEDRPEAVTVELWQNGSKVAEQVISAEGEWEYVFYVPAYDSDGALYRYEVKEAPVENYVIRSRDHDGIRFITESMESQASTVFFRRDGRWYIMYAPFRGGIMTIPGDAFYIPVGVSEISIPSVERITLTEKAGDIADSWSSYQSGEEISIDDWLSGSDLIEDAEEGVVIPLTGSDTELMTIMGNYIEMADYKDLHTITSPYPFKVADDRSHIFCGTYDMKSITNVNIHGKTEITGQKKWDKDPHPEKVTVILKQNGEELKRTDVTERNDWTYIFRNIPIFDDQGNEYEYTVTERPIKGYVMTRETGMAENYSKAVRVTYEINKDASLNKLKDKYYVTYDNNGTAYKYKPDLQLDSGEYSVVFPSLDFDLAFVGDKMIMRGIQKNTKGFPVRVTSVEIIDSPYEYSEGSYFADPDDAGARWTAFDPASEEYGYPDRIEMYHYGADEKGALANIYSEKTGIIPYTIGSGRKTENLRNEYKEGKVSVKKTDEEGNSLKDAEFGLYFTENCPDDIIWTKSEQEPTASGMTNDQGELSFENVPCGCYLLEEIKATPGYKTDINPVKVVIGDEEKTISISNEKTKTLIQKIDEKGEPLAGARLGLYDSTGQEIDLWTTAGDATHLIMGLAEDETYVLKEIMPPEGYRTAKDISFTVRKGEDTTVTMKDRPEYVFMPIPTGVKTTGILIPVFLMVASVIMRKLKYYKR